MRNPTLHMMRHGILAMCYVREFIWLHISQKYVDSIIMYTSVQEVKCKFLQMSCSFVGTCEACDIRDFR